MNIMKKYPRFRKVFCFLIGLIFLFVISASFLLVIKEQNHHCSGQDCPICHEIMICQNILHSISGNTGSICLAIFFLIILSVLQKTHDVCQTRQTLVSLKVKLTD